MLFVPFYSCFLMFLGVEEPYISNIGTSNSL